MKGKSLKLNFVMNAILTMSSIIFPLITFRYVSNILLPDGTGKVSFAISLITYFNMKLIPSLKYLEKHKNKIITGKVNITEAAYIGPGNVEF